MAPTSSATAWPRRHSTRGTTSPCCTATQTDELPGATHLLADRDGDLSVLDGADWDATIDVCAYLPGQVRHLHDALGDRGGHHLFVSTVSVYQEPDRAGADEDSPLFADGRRRRRPRSPTRPTAR